MIVCHFEQEISGQKEPEKNVIVFTWSVAEQITLYDLAMYL